MMRPKKNQSFLGGQLMGVADRVNQFREDRPEAAKALGGLSGMGMVNALRERMKAKREMENGGIMKYRTGGMIYAQDSDQVTEKKKRLVQSPYGSGEDRITEEDIKRNRSLNPFEEYGGYTIEGDDYGKARQAVGFHSKKMDSPGYFLMEGYTDEQQMKNVEKGRPDAAQQYILEVNPDGSKRVIPTSQIMDEFTTGAEDESFADVLEAMNVGITRTDKGFTMPSREEQIRTLMDRRENYGLGNIGFKELQKELGLVAPDLQPGEFARMVQKSLQDRERGIRN